MRRNNLKCNDECDAQMKVKIQTLIDQCYSTNRISKELGLANGTLRYWIKKLGLIPAKDNKLNKNGVIFKKCFACEGVFEISENFRIQKYNGKSYSWCKSCELLAKNKYSREFKQNCVEYKGGKCVKCGYNRYVGAIDFHHLDPSQKDFKISSTKCFNDVTKKELDKCVPLCKNCHAELHDTICRNPNIDIATLLPKW